MKLKYTVELRKGRLRSEFWMYADNGGQAVRQAHEVIARDYAGFELYRIYRNY